jgi:hypothetical protein
MLELPNTAENITLIQDFLDETRRRIIENLTTENYYRV